METGGKIVFAPFFIDFGMDVPFHLRQLIVRVRSRLFWRNMCCEDSFILSLGICFVEDETSGDFHLFSIAWSK